MSWRSALAWIVALAVLALAATRTIDAPDGGDSTSAPAAGATVDATITRVVDGDTVVARIDGGEQRLRYIGVDTPETVKPGTPVQCFGKVASAYNHRLVEGRRVQLQIGRERFDRYDRLLAYVFLPGSPRTFVNAELVRRGYARTLTIPPNTEYAARFAALERQAQRDDVGLWRAC